MLPIALMGIHIPLGYSQNRHNETSRPRNTQNTLEFIKPLKYYGINLSLIVVTFLITSIVIGSIAFTLGRYAGSRAQIREHKDKEIVIIKKILSTYQVSELQVSNSSGNHIHIYGNLSNVNDLKSIKNEIETNLGKASDTNIQFDIELVH